VKCDLRNAVIESDCAISATSIFGGIDIFVPDNINVKINSNSIFGGVSQKNRRPNVQNAVTVYINATCMFGGVEVK
ncbi:MAG: LiaF domain-containing protein, partial [Acutalibacteraceae bacterium]